VSVARSITKSPQIDPIVLHDLGDNGGSLLRAGDSRDAERFSGAELGGLDLTGITFRECEFSAVSLNETKLRGATFSECIASDLHAPVFSAPRSMWRDVRIEHSRLGSVEVYEATMRSVQIDGSKLDFVNLRNAALTDVLLSNCIIDELDLGSATVQRLELSNCRIGTLEVGNARLKDVDLRSSDFGAIHGVEGLRGVTIDDAQLSLLAPILAAHLGIAVE
jgi:uncharacterized protein YjbI with pentapeptide repeats